MGLFALGVAIGMLVAYVAMRIGFAEARRQGTEKIERMARDTFGVLRERDESLESLVKRCLSKQTGL